MGCTSSRPRLRPPFRGRQWKLPRSFSNLVHHPAGHRGDTHHIVSLTSSTLGSLRLDSDFSVESVNKSLHDRGGAFSTDEEAAAKGKTWSELIESNIPTAPARTQTGEPETINAWELMAGLEDVSPLRRLPVVEESKLGDGSAASLEQMSTGSEEISDSASVIVDFDPEVLTAFEKALEEMSPEHTLFSSSSEKSGTTVKEQMWISSDSDNDHQTIRGTSLVRKRIHEFQEKINARRTTKSLVKQRINSFEEKISAKRARRASPPGADDKVVMYSTSLRGIRKTHEDCCEVRAILMGYGVRVDERDVSMHGSFKEELSEALGRRFGGGNLPVVFVNGRRLGGAEEVRRLHETGELGKALQGCEFVGAAEKGGVRAAELCRGCGDMRFVPCAACFGSCKVFLETLNGGEGRGGFRRCSLCNENGLVRCPACGGGVDGQV